MANEHYMDLAFTGEPIRELFDVYHFRTTDNCVECSEDDGTCTDLYDEYRWESRMTYEDALRFKYVVDVDGNAWSARFKRLLTSGSLIFKSTLMREYLS